MAQQKPGIYAQQELQKTTLFTRVKSHGRRLFASHVTPHYSGSYQMTNTTPFGPVRRWKAAACLTLASVLSACGGGGSNSDSSGNPIAAQAAANQGGETPQNPATAKTAEITSQAAAVEAGAKALAATSLRNLTIASFDPASPQWLVRAVIDDRFFDNQNGKGVALNSVSRFAGICAAGPAPCRFDTYAVAQLADGTIVESITAYGRYWNFDVAGNAWGGNGSDLKTVARFANGPCLQAVQTNTPCRFESRTFGRLGKDSPIWVESITADGKGYNFDENGTPSGGNGFDLKSIARFAQGPCANVPAGTPCQFTARTFHPVLTSIVEGASWLEWVVRDGFVWVFDLNGEPRDSNTYQRTGSRAGTPADQVNLLKTAFGDGGGSQAPLIAPGLASQLYTCNLRDAVNGVGTGPLSQQAVTFYADGHYDTQAYDSSSVYAVDSSGRYSFNETDGAIRFSKGIWLNADGQLNKDGTLLKLGTSVDVVPLKKIAECVPRPPGYVLVPPTTGTGTNPLIADGATSASFRCTIDVRLPLGGGIFTTVKTPAGGTELNRDGSYSYTSGDTGTLGGQYAILAGQRIEFVSGFWRTPDGSGRFGSFPADGTQFLANWTPSPASGLRGTELATCVRIGSKSDVDAGPPKSTIQLADEAKACLNYPDANQCEASKLFVSILGVQAEPRSVTYWAGVPLATAEKRRMFVDTYAASVNAFVTGLYKGCLLRDPDSAAYVDYWRSFIEGNGVIAAARLFEGSAEAVAKGSPCTLTVGP
jgi:hypothetical protein